MQRMFGRRTRTLLHTTPNMLEPHGINIPSERKKMRWKQMKSAWYHDQKAKDLEALDEGEVVRIKPFVLGKKKWEKGVVKKRLDERSYEVRTDEGVLRRNRVYLRKSSEPDILGNYGDTADEAEISERNAGIEKCTPNIPVTPRKPVAPAAVEPVMESEAGTDRVARKSRGHMPVRFKDFVLK